MDRTQYRGKNFALLILATCAPAAVLYLRLVLEVVASQGHVSATANQTLGTVSAFVLVFYVGAQLWCAAYLQKLLKPRQRKATKLLQFVAVFLMGLLFSITGAVMLEAFGVNVLVRAGLIH